MREHETDQNTSELNEYVEAAESVYADRAPEVTLDALGSRLIGEFQQAENDRRLTELRWLEDLRQFKGQYSAETLALIGEKRSKAFYRKTRVKVKTVDARLTDLLFPAGSEKNWTINPTPKPSISPEHRAEIEDILRKAGNMPAGTRVPDDLLQQAYKEFAGQAAKKMALTIEDQLSEARYKKACVQAIHSGNLYGTGILKGPLVERKVYSRFVREKQDDGAVKWVHKTEAKLIPFVDHVPIWRFYPDMAATELAQCRYVYERHNMSRSDLAELACRKSFRGDVIKAYIQSHPDGEIKLRYFDNEIRITGLRTTTQGKAGGQYEILERWGYLTGDDLHLCGIEIPEERRHETFFSNVWLLPNGHIIKAVLQPIDGVTWPYRLYTFDKDETSLFGEGLATIMRDDQTMINAAIRMMLDNAAITAGPQLEVAVGLLSAMERTDEIVPFKIWKRNAESPGQRAVSVLELPNNVNHLSAMAQMFEGNLDEVTAIPRYMSGDNPTSGAAGTSSGLSMLMAASNIVIKDLVTSWEEGITQPFITDLFRWNMRFSSDESIKGDFDVVARGTSSLVAKEVRTQQLAMFRQTAAATPQYQASIKWTNLLRQEAEANELSDIVKTDDEMQAEQQDPAVQQMQQMQQAAQKAQVELVVGQAQKAMAEAELTKKKLDEIMANIELTMAKAVESKVEAAYAALQAGGVATSTPYIAPAGDEILRSAGWKDATPRPTLAQLDGPPVQAEQINPAQAAAVQGRQAASTTDNPLPATPTQPQPPQVAPNLEPQTGEVGMRRGIETTRTPD